MQEYHAYSSVRALTTPSAWKIVRLFSRSSETESYVKAVKQSGLSVRNYITMLDPKLPIETRNKLFALAAPYLINDIEEPLTDLNPTAQELIRSLKSREEQRRYFF